MKNIKTLYKWCAALLVGMLIFGLIFRVRTLIVLFDLFTAIAILALVAITAHELYTWYKERTAPKNTNQPEKLNKK